VLFEERVPDRTVRCHELAVWPHADVADGLQCRTIDLCRNSVTNTKSIGTVRELEGETVVRQIAHALGGEWISEQCHIGSLRQLACEIPTANAPAVCAAKRHHQEHQAGPLPRRALRRAAAMCAALECDVAA